jgi:CheY-like chemotaxis protein
VKPRILIVDDEFGLAEVMSALLQAEGYEVTTAANGRAGLEALAAGGADLIFLDIMMPIMDGPEALSRIRADASFASFASTPVVMMTAAPSALVAIDRARYQASLRKPFTPEALLDVVARWLPRY